MKYLSRFRATYEMWIDANCLLGRRWKLKRVGVLLLLDENDVVMLAAEKRQAVTVNTRLIDERREQLNQLASVEKRLGAAKNVTLTPLPRTPVDTVSSGQY